MNFDLINQPNNIIYIMDGRLGLLLTKNLYNAILQFASLEGVPGISTIKSVEFLKIIKSKLTTKGFYLSYSDSKFSAISLQKTFKYVYKIQNVPVLLSTDVPVTSLFSEIEFNKKIILWDFLKPELNSERIFTFSDLLNKFYLLPKLEGRFVRDIDPCADYEDIIDYNLILSDKKASVENY